ncbi:hypothetical protein PIB30_068864 [Stylosanthes scabra]|uniref:Uncharacterized protein n=1 Tax=Stylosanthes scabra TaxID=79078 RepID=A0ABU6VQG8_9FABA|nr:hypothetical protein [Stylosanthes scabra]
MALTTSDSPLLSSTSLILRVTQRKTRPSEKLDIDDSGGTLHQLSKLEPIPEKSDNIRNENLRPMDSQYGQSAKTTINKLVGPHEAILLVTRVLPFLAFASYNSQNPYPML